MIRKTIFKMTLFTNLVNNLNLDFNTLSVGFLGGLTCFITGSIIKNIWFTDSTVDTGLETPTTDSGVDTIRALSSNIPSPTINFHAQGDPSVYHFTHENLRSIQSAADQLANLNSSSTLNSHSTSRILETWEGGTHRIFYPDLNVEVVQRTENITDLANAGRFDQLSQVMGVSTTPTHMDILMQHQHLLERASTTLDTVQDLIVF